MIFDVQYAVEILPRLLAATRITLYATAAGMAIALVVGLLLATARMSPIRPLAFAAAAYVEFIRGTPLLIQLFFLFYVLPEFGLTFDALHTGIVALGLHNASYISEVYRAGIQGVARGQWEAARALNMDTVTVWRRVILPQAIPPVIPALGNYAIGMFKETPLLATITVVELMGQALTEGGKSYRYYEPFTIVGLIFLALSYPSALVVRRLEARFART